MNLYGIYSKSLGRIVYIGITTRSVNRRFLRHCALAAKPSPKTKLHRAIKKYGVANFQAVPLARAPDIETLKQMERDAIVSFGTFWENGDGYNLTHGGDGSHGHKQPQWAIDKRAAINRGNKCALGHRHTDEARAKIRLASLGRPGGFTGGHHTDAAKRKIGDASRVMKTGVPRSPETIEKMRLAMTGRTLSPEHCLAVSIALSGKPKSEEHNRKVGDALRGKPKSEAHRAALKAAWARRRLHNAPITGTLRT